MPRRSPRLRTYDSNGRDYLASIVDISREAFEAWVAGPTVRPYLILWYRSCIITPYRFNEGVEWINEGTEGYFYNTDDLECDLLLMCLIEGDATLGLKERGIQDIGKNSYASEEKPTSKWLTQEIWARTAWRIVHANKGPGQMFEKKISAHASFCYAVVTDMLCIAFHSIAFRERASIWATLIMGHEEQVTKMQDVHMSRQRSSIEQDAYLFITDQSSSLSMESHDNTSDPDFSEVETVNTSGERQLEGRKDQVNVGGIEFRDVSQWLQDLPVDLQDCQLLEASSMRLREIDTFRHGN